MQDSEGFKMNYMNYLRITRTKRQIDKKGKKIRRQKDAK